MRCKVIGVGAIALALGLCQSSAARADAFGGGDPGDLGTALAVVFLDIPAALLSLPPDVINLVHIGRGTRSGPGSRAFGYVIGVVSVVAGTLTMLVSSGSDDQGTGYAIGVSTIGLGLVDVGLAAWSGALPPVTVKPLLAKDIAGHAVRGAEIVVLHF